MIKHCLSVNEAFLEPLPYSEIKATAKSIATYCWKKDAYCYQEFIDRQTRKGNLGRQKGNSSNGEKARSDKYENLRKQAIDLKNQGLNNSEIARALCVSRPSIKN